MEELLEFLDKYGVDYEIENEIENGKVICRFLDLSYKGIKELPENIGSLECEVLYLYSNNLKELPKSIGDIICKEIHLHDNDIPKNKIKYLDLIENLEYAFTDYSNDLSEIKQLCNINSRKEKIKSLLD
jgi:Leucine-rich repeat (LRR) protein